MRIGLDIRPFLKRETGVGNSFKHLLFSLAQIDRKNEYFLFTSSLKDRFSPDKIPPFEKMHFRDFRYPVRVIDFFWGRLGWPALDGFYKIRLDLTHSPSPLILPTKGKKIVTVHDLFYLDFPLLVDRNTRSYMARRTRACLLQANGIITVSNFVKNQMLERYDLNEEKIKVIHHGLDTAFLTEAPAGELERIRKAYRLPETFILYVGTIEPRKNITVLLDALKTVHKAYGKIPLVLAGGKGICFDRVEEKIRALKLKTRVRLLGYVGDRDLRALYRASALFVFPSLCEGFGLPLLEAMASGIPVAAARAAALPEIGKGAAVYFDPEDPDDMADKMTQVLKDDDLRTSLVKRGKKRVELFDWTSSAKKTLSFYRNITGCS